MAKAVFVTLLALLGLPIVLSNVFADWQFKDYRLQDVRTVVTCFIIAWLIVSFAATKLSDKTAIIMMFIMLTGFAGCAGWFLTQPLDAAHRIYDVATIKTLNNGQKIVARKMFNPKHNRWDRDTVVVVDKGPFRRIIK